jgi:hypothetical protein
MPNLSLNAHRYLEGDDDSALLPNTSNACAYRVIDFLRPARSCRAVRLLERDALCRRSMPASRLPLWRSLEIRCYR